MIPTNETRKIKYRGSTETVQNLYSSPESGEFLREKFLKNALDDRDYRTYVLTIGDVILGFYPKSQLSQLLQKNLAIPSGIAEAIATDLKEFLAPIPEAEAVPDIETATETPIVAQSDSVTPQPLTPQVDKSEPLSVPRYAKPLTDLPRYNENQQ